MKRLILGMIIPLLWMTNIYADDADPGGKIKGKIIDNTSGTPIEYATIAVYKAADSTLVTGTISNPEGAFITSKLPEGEYYVLVNFLGYEEQEYQDVRIAGGSSNFDLGMMNLELASTALDEVVISTERNPVEFHIDKKVVSVGEQMTSASLSAVEVLENVPSIRVDIEGNVSLRGSTGFTVLIDGKPTILDPSDALRQTPASTIEKIEIITNPSAKYQPDGTGGIINIITKKNRVQGLQGLFNLKAGSTGMYSGDFLLNYRMKNLNTFIGGDYSSNPFPGYQVSERHTTMNDTTTIIKAEGDSEFNRGGGGFRAGLDWDITPRDNFSISTKLGKFSMKHGSELDYLSYQDPLTSTLTEFSSNEFGRSMLYLNLTGTYLHKFNQKDHELMLQVNYRKRYGDELSENILMDSLGNITNGSQTTEVGPMGGYEVKLDYSKPVGENHSMEAGFQLRTGRSSDETALYTYNPASGDFEFVPGEGHSVNYMRDIYSVYGIFKGETGSLGYQAGLRGEYTYRNIWETEAATDNMIDRYDFYPTLHLSYQLPKENQLMASYSRRVDHPRGYYLEPFITWTDMYNVRSGNPALESEYIDAMELGFIKSTKKSQFSIEAYYRIKHNKIERVQEVYQEGVLLSTVDNVGTDYSLGTEALYNISIFPWWELNLMADLYDYRIKSEDNGVPYTYHSFNWGARTNNTFNIAKKVRLQFDGNYNSPTITTQGEQKAYYSFNAAVRSDFLDKKLSLTLQVRDVFNTYEHINIVEDTDFYNYQSRKTNGPIVSLTASYRLNNYRAANKTRQSNGGGGEEDF